MKSRLIRGKRVHRQFHSWQSRDVSTQSETEFFTIPELVELLGVSPGKVHSLIEQRHLAAIRVDGVLKVPAQFLLDGEPLPSLHGTLMLLHDAGYSEDEAVAWMLSADADLDVAPIQALRAGRKSEVRRIAQSLAF